MSSIDGKDSQARKDRPIMRGCLDYFPDALLAVAEVSRIGNEKHNPGQPMHHARGKSTDHADCAVRHLMDRGKFDIYPDGTKLRHTAEAAWRVLAELQEELERDGEAPLARAAKLPDMPVMTSATSGETEFLDPDKMPWLARCSAPGAICPTKDPRTGPADRRIKYSYDRMQAADRHPGTRGKGQHSGIGRRKDDKPWA